MYCPACGKTIADDSSFCQHCGKPIPGAKQTQPVKEWEYEVFVHPLPPNSGSCSLDTFTKSQAAHEFWREQQHNYLIILQEWINEGWNQSETLELTILSLQQAHPCLLNTFGNQPPSVLRCVDLSQNHQLQKLTEVQQLLR